ncbi:hypothetical protein CMO88_02490 [Candidatus Woesearchaeota archaeon]|nr:hypothetical protein [Candidatus Woesearchaeota archaeon]|tara:strand:+ start:3986 stop:5071 length:1086 start_codon:yes stop_codon:yes gene_type:complete
MYSTITNYSSNSNGYGSSNLENIVAEYSVETSHPSFPVYHIQQDSKPAYNKYKTIAEEQPAAFLNPKRPDTPFIGQAAEIAEPIKQAFFSTTGNELPEHISITIATRDELIQKNLAFLNDSVVGISISQTKEVFAVAGKMDEVMLTVGHELGHIIKEPARTPQEEEAKAFAFETAWAKTIFEHDIAGLRNSINAAMLNPAKNGLHDVAFNFVKNNSEIEPLNLFNSISQGNVTAEQVFEGTQLNPITTIKGPLYSLPQKNKTKLYGGYLNKSRVQNLPPPHNFFWADLGKGIYGMYVPMTTVETLNSELLRKDIEQMHKTMGHEYSLHHVMGLPDGYVVEALEEAMFWTAEDDDNYYPKKS